MSAFGVWLLSGLMLAATAVLLYLFLVPTYDAPVRNKTYHRLLELMIEQEEE